MIIFTAWLVFTIVVGILANNKNRSVPGWVILSLFISPLLAGILLLVLPKIELLKEEDSVSIKTTTTGEILLDDEMKKCPSCAESIKLEAKKCRFCGEVLNSEEVAKEVEKRKLELAAKQEKEREGKKQCPQCGSWDVHTAMIEGGGMGDWCPHCKKSLKKMKV